MRIYFDHNATTPIHPKVQDTFIHAMKTGWANPSSLHQEGQFARHAIEAARKQVASLVSAKPEEVIFTSGGTEANNAALWGMFWQVFQKQKGSQQIISSKLEHPSVRSPLLSFQELGHTIYHVNVTKQGLIDLDDLENALKKKTTTFVSFSFCNHEIGNIYPIVEITKLAHQYGALVHCDGVQAAGRIPIYFNELDVDFLSCSAHKMYGPKGVGALLVRESKQFGKIPSFLQGGGQEKGRRAGTENGPAIVAFGMACELAQNELLERMNKTMSLREQLENRLLKIPGATLQGDPNPQNRAPGTCNIGFMGVDAELLMMSLDVAGVSVSTGAACSSGSLEPSQVLLGLGLRKDEAKSAVRFSIGYENTEEQVAQVSSLVEESINRIRAL